MTQAATRPDEAPIEPRAVPARRPFAELERRTDFQARHIGLRPEDEAAMLAALGLDSMDAFIRRAVPASILAEEALPLGEARTEPEVLDELRAIAARNEVFKSFIGMGYHACHTPTVILRNVLENPAWYTAYTPYQPEISQGRLEALLELPDDGHGPHWARHRQRFAARRGNRRRRSDGALSARAARAGAARSSSQPTAIRRRSMWCGRAPSRSASTSWSATLAPVSASRTVSACCCNTRALPARSTISARP